MPIELTDLFSKRQRKVMVIWGDGPDDSLTVSYKPDAFTVSLNAEMQAAAQGDGTTEGDGIKAMATMLCALVVDWDITEGGKPYKPTPENLERLGMPLMAAIAEAVQADFSVGKAKATTSVED